MRAGTSPGSVALRNLKSAPRILDRAEKAVARWGDHAGEAGVSAKSSKAIAERPSEKV